MAYKSGAKKPKLSKAAKEAATRTKAHKQARNGKLAKAVKTLSAATKSRRMTKGEKRAILITPFKPQIVKQPDRTPKMDKGLSLNMLIKSTPRLMKENAMECYVTAYRTKKTPKGLKVVTASVRHKDPLRPNKTVRIHKPVIIGLEDPFKPIHKQKRVMVSCPCENFVYMWEYADAEHGAAKIIYGNGEAPDFTNPGRAPGLCKHLTALADLLKRNGD